MNALRLLPLVIVATSALFVLRGISIVSDGAFNAFGTSSSAAQQAPAAPDAMPANPTGAADGQTMAQNTPDAELALNTPELQQVPADGAAAEAAIPEIRAFNEAEVRA